MRDTRIGKTCIGLAAAGLLMAASGALATPQEDADALFAAEEWVAAAEAYDALLAADPANGANWFNLARARHSAEDLRAARAAYLQAIEAGYTPAARAHFHLARALMTLGDTDGALTQIEAIAASGTPLGSTIQATAEFEGLAENARFAAAITAMAPCTDPVYRAFDFWLGEWDVNTPSSPQTASSRISSRHGGCVVLEEFDAGAYSGMSINFVDSTTGRWHQSWMANNGIPIYLEGNLNAEGAMVLSDADLPISTATGTINRVTWSQEEGGAVRQFWEVSSDGGETWSTAFDGLYTPRAADAED